MLVMFGACHPRATDAPGTGPPASSAQATRNAGGMRCEPAPPPSTTPHAATGLIPAWQASLGEGTGALHSDVTSGLVVARLQGGKSVSIDLETGAPCATLVERPRSEGPAPNIDPYTARSAPVHGTLVGPSGLHVSAVALGTGQTLWSRQLIGVSGDFSDTYALRDAMQAVGAGPLAVIGYHVRHQDNDRYRFEEILAGVDPATGEERWRRSVVQHAWNAPLHAGGDMRLGTDGPRAIVETPDRLLAIDGATGAEAWSAPWPRDRRRRAFVGAGRVLVVQPGSSLALRDASDGKVLAEMPSPGRSITDAVVRRDAVVVAVEEAPGRAFLAAIDTSGRVQWKRDAAYSVARLRALEGDEPSAVYVLDGNARLWAFDERTGAAQSGMAVGSADDFALARTRAGGVRVVLPLPEGSLAAFDLATDAQPKALDPFLRWHFEERMDADGRVRCHPDEVAWVDGDDEVVWNRALPARTRATSWGLCDDHEVAYYLRRPRYAGISPHLLTGASAAGDMVAVADMTGVLALARKDGAVLLDRAARRDDQALFFDSGTFALDSDPPCSGQAPHGQVFAQCGSSLVYFNGSTALLIDMGAWRVEAESALTPAMVTSRGVKTEAAIPLGARILSLRGRTYMR